MLIGALLIDQAEYGNWDSSVQPLAGFAGVAVLAGIAIGLLGSLLGYAASGGSRQSCIALLRGYIAATGAFIGFAAMVVAAHLNTATGVMAFLFDSAFISCVYLSAYLGARGFRVIALVASRILAGLRPRASAHASSTPDGWRRSRTARLLSVLVRLLPDGMREVKLEEWLRDLAEPESSWERRAYLVDLVSDFPRMVWAAYRDQREGDR
jgi:hypothetical protein